MSRMPRATYLWPGLPQLWHSGLWSGLLLAVGFAALLNLLVLASFVWIELLSPLALRLGWLAVGTLWCVSVVISTLSGPRSRRWRGKSPAEVLFREALDEYLQGNWFESERILDRLLRLHPRDVEARLMRATLYRHTRRYSEALAELTNLERFRDAQAWALEIESERQWIAQRQADAADLSPPAAADRSESPALDRAA